MSPANPRTCPFPAAKLGWRAALAFSFGVGFQVCLTCRAERINEQAVDDEACRNKSQRPTSRFPGCQY
jgi:hypothetical protein